MTRTPSQDATWEQRWHPLRREWVVVSAHRNRRPWRGEPRIVSNSADETPSHDPTCTFCPGNRRSSGLVNPTYDGVFAFTNDHPCVDDSAPIALPPAPGSYRNRPATGVARVVCFAPEHNLSLSRMSPTAIDSVLATWQDEYQELGQRPDVRHVLTFENRGEAVGVSNPHPHGQIYATNFVFPTIAVEVEATADHYASHGQTIWDEIVRTELEDGRRIVDASDHAIAFVPYFARWAYESMIGPRRTVASLADLEPGERVDLAHVLARTLTRYDRMWSAPMPYVLVLHQAPTDGSDYRAFGFHIEVHPALRSPGLRKYAAGPEIGGGGFLADTSPEAAAEELRASLANWDATQ